MAEIRFDGVTKVYGDGTRAVSAVDLEIADQQFVVLVGPSGCGKTTLLRMVAGLEHITGGEIRIGGRVINDVPAKSRDIAMVFQNYALYPHMTVRDNIGFGLKLRRVPKKRIGELVVSAAETLGLVDQLGKRPGALSGGQRQRVAMGRAMVREPQAFLMDEPLSNLDAKLRVQMRTEIGRRQKELGVTTLYVTHDQTEAMTLGDQVAVMRRGVIQQVAEPAVLFDRPANLFVASFIGSPAMNFVEATLEASDGTVWVAFGSTRLRVPATVVSERSALVDYVGRKLALGIRPEDFASSVGEVAPHAHVLATVEVRETLGREAYLHFLVDAPPVFTEDIKEIVADTDAVLLDDLLHTADADTACRFVARVSSVADAQAGDIVELAVNTDALHFFDLDSGQSIYAK